MCCPASLAHTHLLLHSLLSLQLGIVLSLHPLYTSAVNLNTDICCLTFLSGLHQELHWRLTSQYDHPILLSQLSWVLLEPDNMETPVHLLSRNVSENLAAVEIHFPILLLLLLGIGQC